MKIVFWSHVRGQCGTTLHMASVAVAQALYSDSKIVMMENHDHLINIETCLVNKPRDEFLHETGRYNSYGLENLMEQFKTVETENEEHLIRKCAMSFIHDRLFYLPHGYLKNRDLLDYEFSRNMVSLFSGLEKYFDTVFIDTFATGYISTKSIVDSADLVVVNLNQNQTVIDHFFNNFSMLRNKAIFILGSYNPGRINNIKSIRRKYQIPEERIYAVPFCLEAAEAETSGGIVNYIARNYMEPSLDNRDYINSIKKISAAVSDCSRSINYINRFQSVQ